MVRVYPQLTDNSITAVLIRYHVDVLRRTNICKTPVSHLYQGLSYPKDIKELL